jgi:addiction module RelB/DinJ family antitoxin
VSNKHFIALGCIKTIPFQQAFNQELNSRPHSRSPSPLRRNQVPFRARVPARRLKKAEKILDQLGLKPGDAFNLLLAQIELRHGLPFEVTTQNHPARSAEEQATVWTDAFGPY